MLIPLNYRSITSIKHCFWHNGVPITFKLVCMYSSFNAKRDFGKPATPANSNARPTQRDVHFPHASLTPVSIDTGWRHGIQRFVLRNPLVLVKCNYIGV